MAKVEVKKIEDLIPDPNNANKHTQRGHALVENSIRRRGVGRWQHQVDYRQFKSNRLIKKEGAEIHRGVNNYGMKLIKNCEKTVRNGK